ncbi:MAG: glycerophosphodiester phosphodiesterase family protein [Flavobacteriales bacterium]
MESSTVSIHGHRGCRGMWPENSLKAFEVALELGLEAIELDVVLTGTGDLLVSHDPFMHHEICSHPDRSEVTPDEEMSLNIFRMSTTQAQTYRCGMRPHPRFPEQIQFECHKPTLLETVNYVHELLSKKNKSTNEILWNIEIKSQPQWDDIYHPAPDEYVRRFLLQFVHLQIDDHCVIQSFDPRILEQLHIQAPNLRLVLLNEDATKTAESKLRELSFKPFGFSPNFTLIDESVVAYCITNKIELIAWTVNEKKDLEKMQQLGVKHIITDYPERALELFHKKF